MNRVFLAGTGSYLPGEPISFDRAQEILGPLPEAPARIRHWLETTHPVMRDLLAIDQLHYAIDPVTREFTEDNVSMAVKAARRALEMAGLEPADIGLICYGSSHQDQMPTASVRIQEALGIESCEEYAIHANCSSAYKALHIARELLRNGSHRRALVLSANMASSELRAEYYNQALVDKESLFLRWFLCDGAGACVLSTEEADSRSYELLGTHVESIGGKRPSMMFNHRPAYWMNPAQEYAEARHHLRQQFRNALSTALFQEATGSVFINGLERMLARFPIDRQRVRCFQVNFPAKHIVESVLDEIREHGIPAASYYTRMNSLGYSGPPMVLIGLDRMVREEHFEPGDYLISFVTEVSKFMQAGYVIRRL